MGRPRFPIKDEARAMAEARQLYEGSATLREVAAHLRRRRFTRTTMSPASMARALERAGAAPKRIRGRS